MKIDKLIKILKGDIVDDDTISSMIVSDHDDNDEIETIANDEDHLAEYVYETVETIDEDDNVVLYNCDVCNIEFESIDEHLEKYHSNQDVVVNIDDDEIIQKFDESTEKVNEIESEINKIESIETFTCNQCNSVFNSLLSLSTHIRSTHENRMTTRRAIKKKSESNAKGDKVIDSGNAEGDNVCHICNTTFASAKSYKLHARMHNKTKGKQNEEALEQDTLPIDDDLQEKFYCNICDKYYLKNYEEIHMQMHSGEEKFNCKICNKLFPNEAAIKMHMNAHQEPRVVSFK